MTFARVNPLGWALFEELTSAQMNQLDINVTRALDGHSGGAYTPSAPIEIGGSGLKVSAGALAEVDGTLRVDGAGEVAAGATMTWKGANLAHLPAMDARTYTYRLPLIPIPTDYTLFDEWVFSRVGGTSGWWRQVNVSIPDTLWFPVTGLAARGTITDVEMTIQGDGDGSHPHSDVPSSMPRIRLLRDSLGSVTELGSVTDGTTDEVVYDSEHTVGITGLSEPYVQGTAAYYVEVRGESGTNSVANALALKAIRVSLSVTLIGP